MKGLKTYEGIKHHCVCCKRYMEQCIDKDARSFVECDDYKRSTHNDKPYYKRVKVKMTSKKNRPHKYSKKVKG
jgi:hypothetical protein